MPSCLKGGHSLRRKGEEKLKVLAVAKGLRDSKSFPTWNAFRPDFDPASGGTGETR